MIFINENDFYVKAKEVIDGIEYKNTDQAIRHHVSDEDKKTLEEIIKLNSILNIEFEKINRNEKNIIFINETGLYYLIMTSKKDRSKTFKKFVDEYMMPKLK